MQIRSRQERLKLPDRLDRSFGAVAGLYLATLLSPAILSGVVQLLDIDSYLVAAGLLCAIGAVITAGGSWLVTCQSSLLLWFDSSWRAALVPAVGILPLFAYAFQALLFVGISVTDLQPESAAHLVGFIGFTLGLGAICLGGGLVQMARNRLVAATVEHSAVTAEWAAGWPNRDRLKLALGSLVLLCLVAGVVFWRLGSWESVLFLQFVGALSIGVRQVVSQRTYRVTPDGLELRRDRRLATSRRFVPWSEFEGFTATDDVVVLHRPFPHLSLRWSQWDLDLEETDVVTALEAHLDRR